MSLYLGAVAEVFQNRLRLPPRLALAGAVLLTLAAIITLFRLLVPPVIEQTQQLVRVLPQYVESWELAIGRFVARYPAMSDMWRPGDHRLMTAIYEASPARLVASCRRSSGSCMPGSTCSRSA